MIRIETIPLFKVICAKCKKQIKSYEFKFIFGPNLKFAQCPNQKCNSIEFHLIKGD